MEKYRGFDPNGERTRYPKFSFENRNADLELVRLVKKATQNFDFNELSKEMKHNYQQSKKIGFEKVFQSLKNKSINNRLSLEEFLRHCWFEIGMSVFEKLSKDTINQYLPLNDFRFFPHGNEIIVQCRGIKKFQGSQGKFYHSYKKPTVEIEGIKYIVAFSEHAIKQICERIHPNWKNYLGLGDVYAYLQENLYFEVCQLRDGSPAITFWDLCGYKLNLFGNKPSWLTQYVTKVLGEENLIIGKIPYFRVGYCPIAFEDKFVIAKTLLFPGYSKTPEYEYILNADLPDSDKRLLKEKITQQDAKCLIKTGDFSAVKWLHLNAIPQVVQMNKLIYDHYETLPSVYHLSK